ncbi:hypothetical protein QUF58_12555 [Anaerolineales bacterium HSG24]|nr:hypothetical protein [Anaerolineales bacterium HSG24]
MRQIVVEAVAQITNQFHKKQPWSNNEIETPVIGKDYSFKLSQEQYRALKQMKTKLEQLIPDLQEQLPKYSIEVGTSTSITIRDQSLIVIELSLYGNLAAVFTYGNVRQATLAKINEVLQKNTLFQLLEEERLELEKQGIYQDLF